MCCQIHKDERGFFVGSRKSRSVGDRFPPAHVVLDLAVIESRNKPLNEKNVVPRRGVGVREVIEDPHPRVQLLD